MAPCNTRPTFLKHMGQGRAGATPTRVTYRQGYFAVGVEPPATMGIGYFDFANHVLGGGILRSGWVQEEQMLYCTDVMQEMAAHQLQHTSLDRAPLLILANAYFRVTNPGGNYGQKIMAAIPNAPVRVNILAAAAPDNSKTPRGSPPRGHRQWFDVARAAFALAVSHGITTVVSGPWGAGVFKNTEEDSAQLQVDAANAAGLPELVLYGFPPIFAQVTAASGTVW